MFSSKYHDVSVGSYAWLVKKINDYDLWTPRSPYGVVVYKDVLMIVKKKNLKIVDAENDILINDAQNIIKEVDDMYEIFIDINKLAILYPPIKDEIMDILYQKVVLDGSCLK